MEENAANSVYQDPWHLKPCGYNPYFFSNHTLDLEMKYIGGRACGSIVSIRVHLEDGLCDRSGFVVDSTLVDAEYINTIFTSACIVRHNKFGDGVALSSPIHIQISVMLAEGTTCLGELAGYDFHYNIAVLKVKTPMPIPALRLAKLDDSISLDPNFIDQPYDHRRDRFRLFPGDAVAALGCNFGYQDFMIVPGKLSITRTGFQCENLLRAECEINTVGIGGPLINRYGEVIGINFLHNHFTPFLPINIASLWWENVKKNGYCVIPRLGLKLKNIYIYPPGYLELVMRTFPNTFTGVVVDKVKSSIGSSTKILKKDIIIECDGKSVNGTLELLEFIWDKAGGAVRLTLLRPRDGSRFHVTVTVGNVGLNQLNRWPLPYLSLN